MIWKGLKSQTIDREMYIHTRMVREARARHATLKNANDVPQSSPRARILHETFHTLVSLPQ